MGQALSPSKNNNMARSKPRTSKTTAKLSRATLPPSPHSLPTHQVPPSYDVIMTNTVA